MVHARPCKSGCLVLILCTIVILLIIQYYNKKAAKTVLDVIRPEVKIMEEIDPKTNIRQYKCVEYINWNSNVCPVILVRVIQLI